MDSNQPIPSETIWHLKRKNRLWLLVVPPLLSLSANGGEVQVAWKSGLPFEPELQRLFKLESSTDLVSTNWTLVPQLPALVNNRYVVSFNPTNKAQIFRLHAMQP